MNWRSILGFAILVGALSIPWAALTALLLGSHTTFGAVALVFVPIAFAGFIVISLLRAVFGR